MSGQRGKVEAGIDRGTPRMVVSCDIDGCRAVDSVAPAATLSYARTVLTRRSWRHVLLKRRQGGPATSIDLCPGHASMEVENMPRPVSPRWRGKRRRTA